MLEEKLIAEGLLTRAGLQEAMEHQKRYGCPLEDSLIDLRLVTERDLLRALARKLRLQYLTLDKVTQIRIQPELLEKVPVRLAESMGVLPFRFDVDEVLWLLTRGPLSEADREQIQVRSEARQLSLLLVRPSVVAAAIRRHYYSDHGAFEAVSNLQPRPTAERVPAAKLPGEPAPARADPEDAQDIITLSRELKCPACGAPASLDDFQCGQCLLLLNPDAGQSDPHIEISVVRALLSVTESRPFLKVPDPPPRDISGDPTRIVPLPLDKKLVPRLVAGVDLALKPLPPFEAYVASYIDGEHSIEELVPLTKLPRAELHALLHSFHFRGIIELEPPPPALSPPPPPPAPQAASPRPPARTPARGSTPASRTPRTEADSVLASAVTLERRGDLAGAIHLLRKGIAQLPQPGPLYNKLALILINQRRDFRQAEELLRKALELEPGNEVYEKNLYKVVTLASLQSRGVS